jgi:hypothetical protein
LIDYVLIPEYIAAGSHRIAVQDSRSIVFGWAPVTVSGPESASSPAGSSAAGPTTQATAKPPAGIGDNKVEDEPIKDAPKEDSVSESDVAAPATPTTSSNIGLLLPLAGGLALLAILGSVWFVRFRRGQLLRR